MQPREECRRPGSLFYMGLYNTWTLDWAMDS